MQEMFNNCESFEGKGLENWNVSNVTNMIGVFNKCINFDCDLSNWNVSKVKLMDNMFSYCAKFTGKGLENWDVSNLISKEKIFLQCKLLRKKPSWYKE